MGKALVLDKQDELRYMTPIKTVMMLIVILYHSCAMWMGGWFAEPANPSAAIGLFAKWLNTFHVPVFVFASGYLYAFLKVETTRYASASLVLKKKARRLLVPYVFVSIVWAIPFWAYFNGTEAVAAKFLLAGSPSQLWFLVMLFVLFFGFELSWIVVGERVTLPSIAMIAAMAVSYVFGAVLVRFMPVDVFQIANALQFAPLFYLGMLLRRGATERFWRLNPIVLVAVHFTFFALATMASMSIGFGWSALAIVLWPLVRIAGTLASVSVMGRILQRIGYEREKLLFGGGFSKRTASLSIYSTSRLYGW